MVTVWDTLNGQHSAIGSKEQQLALLFSRVFGRSVNGRVWQLSKPWGWEDRVWHPNYKFYHSSAYGGSKPFKHFLAELLLVTCRSEIFQISSRKLKLKHQVESEKKT